MNGHHLILGELEDIVTGEILPDTHDERYRQKLAQLLLEKKGYQPDEIKTRLDLSVKAGDKKAIVKIDFLIVLSGKNSMIIKFGPGSLVTRRRPSLAASRLVCSYQVPVIVVTNGEDAEIIDGYSGKVKNKGLDFIPSKHQLIKMTEQHPFDLISEKKAEMESRVMYSFEVDGICECDDSVCRL